jgi:hypothetical protein
MRVMGWPAGVRKRGAPVTGLVYSMITPSKGLAAPSPASRSSASRAYRLRLRFVLFGESAFQQANQRRVQAAQPD